ncbi:hypothetical protein EVAR_18401_1 [Eumeta japonica]|uniref:Uncharacterized protein n=1 Tax=Eumeta variegata TaxID=151549 RepID=A0A4C1UTX6_EUMVA|nr:hypothetical protein EVAR_18401_1 [Eumeta japonica]
MSAECVIVAGAGLDSDHTIGELINEYSSFASCLGEQIKLLVPDAVNASVAEVVIASQYASGQRGDLKV